MHRLCERGTEPRPACARAAGRRARRVVRFPYDHEMFEWPEELVMVRDAVRQFVDNEVRPHREELEHGDLPPYDLLRKMYKTFGMDQMAADGFDRRIAAEEGGAATERAGGGESRGGGF